MNAVTSEQREQDFNFKLTETKWRVKTQSERGKISLKKYYESTDPNSLFQSKAYNIKYESIRGIKLYQSLKR